MKKSELIELALSKGLEVDDSMTMAEINELIEASESQEAAPEPQPAPKPKSKPTTKPKVVEDSDDSPQFDFSKVKELSVTQTRDMTQNQIREYCRIK